MTAVSAAMLAAFVGAVGLTVTPRDSGVDAANASSYSGGVWDGVDIGPASDSRIVLICLHGQNNTTANADFSGVTLGGVAATVQATAIHFSGFDGMRTSIYAVALNASYGTTANLVVTCSATMNNAAYSIYTFEGSSITAAVTRTDTDDPISFSSFDVAAGGFVVALSGTRNDAGSVFGWSTTGLATEDVDATIEGNGQFTTAHENFAAAQTGLTVTQDWGGTDSFSSGCLVVYNP